MSERTCPRTKIRVAQCYSGGVGSEIIRRVAAHSDMELVAVLVHHPDKEGRDAGELVGTRPLGVAATRQLDDVIAAQPDIAVWTGLSPQPEMLVRLLESGINVYSSLPGGPELEAACQRGGVSFGSGGNIPGLVSDALPLFLSGYTGSIRCITAHQRNHVANYPSAEQLAHGLGLGVPTDGAEAGHVDMEAQVDAYWQWLIQTSANVVADGLGIPFGGVRTRRKEKAPAPITVTLPDSGLVIRAGTVGGVRWTWDAYSGDRVFLTVINEQTGVYGLGDGWREDEAQPAWTVTVDASPPLVATLTFPPGLQAATANVALNAARAINFLHALVSAEPGCRSVIDLPMIASTDRNMT